MSSGVIMPEDKVRELSVMLQNVIANQERQYEEFKDFARGMQEDHDELVTLRADVKHLSASLAKNWSKTDSATDKVGRISAWAAGALAAMSLIKSFL